jgi:hypothetical protein
LGCGLATELGLQSRRETIERTAEHDSADTENNFPPLCPFPITTHSQVKSVVKTLPPKGTLLGEMNNGQTLGLARLCALLTSLLDPQGTRDDPWIVPARLAFS